MRCSRSSKSGLVNYLCSFLWSKQYTVIVLGPLPDSFHKHYLIRQLNSVMELDFKVSTCNGKFHGRDKTTEASFLVNYYIALPNF